MHIKIRTTVRSVLQNAAALICGMILAFAGVELFAVATGGPRFLTEELARPTAALSMSLIFVGELIWGSGMLAGRPAVRLLGNAPLLVGLGLMIGSTPVLVLFSGFSATALILAARLAYKQN